jgi:hypothetical protein
MKKFLSLAAMTIVVAACASAPENVHTKGDADGAITAAEHELGRANKLGFEWRDSAKMVKAAKEATKEGKFDEAVKLATVAKNQGKLAIDQAQAQKSAAPSY